MDKNEKQTGNEVTVDIKILIGDLWKGVKKFGFVIIIFASIFSSVAFYFSAKSYTPFYRAKATFAISTGNESENSGSYSYGYFYNSHTASQMALTFPYILQSNILQEIVRNDLNVDYLNGSISSMAVPDTNLFTMYVISTNAEDAYNILNSVIENYPQVAEFVIGDTKMNILSSPTVPAGPYNSPSYVTKVKIGFLTGVLAGCGVIFLYALSRRTVKESADIKNNLSLKCLGVVPKVKFKRRKSKFDSSVLISNIRTGATFAESVRSVRTKILKEIEVSKDRVIMVTSTLPREGKSTISVNLALSLAQKGDKVILVDGDLRNPTIIKLLDIKTPLKGLYEVLSYQAGVKESVIYLPDYGIQLLAGIVPCDRPAGLYSGKKIAETIELLKEMADYVIIDTPPCGVFSDALAIAHYSDTIIYTVRQDYAKTSRIIDSIMTLSSSKTKITGAVLNHAEHGISGYGYGYKYGYNKYGKYKRYYNENKSG